MHISLLKKSIVCVTIVFLVLLNFIPMINSSNIQFEKKFEIANDKNNKICIFTNVEKDRISHDISEIHLDNHLFWMKSYFHDYNGTHHDELRPSMEEPCDEFSDEKTYIIKEMLRGLRDDYTPHDPIKIFSDDDFTDENGVTGGVGTVDDPYIIEGWEIDTTSFAAIYISGTTKYFIIRNCLLKNATYGINLLEVLVGSVIDCYILFNYDGVGLFLSSNIVFKNNNFYNNFYNLVIRGFESCHYYHHIDTSNSVNGKAIYYLINDSGLVFDENDKVGYLGLVGCDDIQVSNVTISNSGDGILLVNTSNSIISFSTFIDCYFGISLFESSNNSFTKCNFVNSSLYLINSSNNFFRNNTIFDIWGVGVVGYSLEDYYQDMDISNTVNGKPLYYLVGEEDMVFSESDVGFLALVNCDNIIVKDVGIDNNWFGMVVAGSVATIDNCETSYNDIGLFVFGDCNLEINDFKTYYNNFGCILFYTSNVEIINCDIAGFIGCIQCEYTHDVTIKKCIFRESNNNAVILLYCWNINIQNNEFSVNDGYSIVLYENCWMNTISRNIINGYCGITIELGSHNNTVCYNILNNLDFCGLFIYISDDNIIHHNNFTDIDTDEYAAGIMIYRSEGNKINRNNIYDNKCGLEASFCNEVNATNNWWGSKDGPSGIGPGSGDSIKVHESNVLFEPWLKQPVSKNLHFNQQVSNLLFLRFLERFLILQKNFLTIISL